MIHSKLQEPTFNIIYYLDNLLKQASTIQKKKSIKNLTTCLESLKKSCSSHVLNPQAITGTSHILFGVHCYETSSMAALRHKRMSLTITTPSRRVSRENTSVYILSIKHIFYMETERMDKEKMDTAQHQYSLKGLYIIE